MIISKNNGNKKIEIWVPLRISGFFQIFDPNTSLNISEISKIGSRGGGPALQAFGKTIIITYLKKKNNIHRNQNYKIYINNKDSTHIAKTSISALKILSKYIPSDNIVEIYHSFDLPLGSGYGTSGAGALGVTFGINKLFNLNLNDLELAKYAHIAEVLNHTGLGTVGGQYHGGLSISLTPGYPFNYQFIKTSEEIRIVIGCFGPISTKSILTDENYKNIIYLAGKKAMNKMLKDFTLLNYMQVCKNFLKDTQIMKSLKLDKGLELIQSLNKLPIYGASMNMLGNSVFCFCNKSQVDSVIEIFKGYNPTLALKSLKICNHGPIEK